MPIAGSTAEDRYMKRRAAIIDIQRKNATLRAFSSVQPGTTALLNVLRENSGLTMDRLLYKLARAGQKFGV